MLCLQRPLCSYIYSLLFQTLAWWGWGLNTCELEMTLVWPGEVDSTVIVPDGVGGGDVCFRRWRMNITVINSPISSTMAPAMMATIRGIWPWVSSVWLSDWTLWSFCHVLPCASRNKGAKFVPFLTPGLSELLSRNLCVVSFKGAPLLNTEPSSVSVLVNITWMNHCFSGASWKNICNILIKKIMI